MISDKNLDISSCNCRKCGLDFSLNDFEYQERLIISFRAGYASIFGDENVVQTVLCQHCVKSLVGDFLEIIQNNHGHNIPVLKPLGAYQSYQVMNTQDNVLYGEQLRKINLDRTD